MLKKISSVFIVFIYVIFISNASSKTPPFDITYLTNNEWISEYRVGVSITFNKDGTYSALADYGQDGEHITGKYKIDNNSLVLYREDNSIYLNNGKLIYEESAVKFNYYLSFDNDTIVYNKKSAVKEGTKVILSDGNKCITTGIKNAKTTSNVKFRMLPDTQGEIIKIYVLKDTGDGPPDEEELSYVPADTEINILARTESKVKVNSWINYWYYVEVPDAYKFSYKKGWMFGEFVLIK